MTLRTPRVFVATAVLAAAATACSSSSGSGSSSMTLYTCTTASVEQAVVAAFEHAHPGAKVNVFRAPTGQLNARVAADTRAGRIGADVIWACDPLTMHGFDKQGLLGKWSPSDAAQIPSFYRTPHFTGIDLLYMIVAVHKGVPPPTSWRDLLRPAYRGAIALPSPTVAASALGLLGYFASAPGYGIAFYQRLKANGAVQADTPDDSLTGVEQGRYKAGVTLANAAYAGQKEGSPIEVVWPRPGAVAIYAPIGLTTKKDLSPLAAQFANFAASRAGQKIMAGLGTYVTLPGLRGGHVPAGSATIRPDWPKLFTTYKSTLAAYAKIFH